MGYSYDFGKTLKNIKENNKNLRNLKKNKLINLPDTNMSNNLRYLGTQKKKFLYEDIVKNSKENIYNKYNILVDNHDIKNKFKKKDYFSLSAPRWDEGNFHDNESHFQIPGPAYYQPREQYLKRSFNLNKKDFIYTNSVPFIEKKYSEC